MTMIQPPSDLTATERKTFRRLACSLSGRGIDVGARLEALVDYVRAESRIADLRRAEAEPARRFQAARAVTMAAKEKRRLQAALWRGARTPGDKPTIADRAAEISRNAAREAWRDFYHGRAAKGTTEAELTHRYGHADIAVVLCPTARAEAIELAYYELCASRRGPVPSFQEFEADCEDDGSYH